MPQSAYPLKHTRGGVGVAWGYHPDTHEAVRMPWVTVPCPIFLHLYFSWRPLSPLSPPPLSAHLLTPVTSSSSSLLRMLSAKP